MLFYLNFTSHAFLGLRMDLLPSAVLVMLFLGVLSVHVYFIIHSLYTQSIPYILVSWMIKLVAEIISFLIMLREARTLLFHGSHHFLSCILFRRILVPQIICNLYILLSMSWCWSWLMSLTRQPASYCCRSWYGQALVHKKFLFSLLRSSYCTHDIIAETS